MDSTSKMDADVTKSLDLVKCISISTSNKSTSPGKRKSSEKSTSSSSFCHKNETSASSRQKPYPDDEESDSSSENNENETTIERVLWMRENACKGNTPLSTIEDDISNKNTTPTVNGMDGSEYINNLQKSFILYKSMSIRKEGCRSIYQPFLRRNLYQNISTKRVNLDKIVLQCLKTKDFPMIGTLRNTFLPMMQTKFEKMAHLSNLVDAIKEKKKTEQKLKDEFNITKSYSVRALSAFNKTGNRKDLFPYKSVQLEIVDEQDNLQLFEVYEPINYFADQAKQIQNVYESKFGNETTVMEIKFVGDIFSLAKKMEGNFYATFICENETQQITFGRRLEIVKNRFYSHAVDVSEIIRKAKKMNAKKLFITVKMISSTGIAERKKTKRAKRSQCSRNEAETSEIYLKSFLIWEKNAPNYGVHNIKDAWFSMMKSTEPNVTIDTDFLVKKQESDMKMMISIDSTFHDCGIDKDHHYEAENIEWAQSLLDEYRAMSISRDLRSSAAVKRETRVQKKKENLLSNMIPTGINVDGGNMEIWIKALKCSNIEYRLFHKIKEVQNLLFHSFGDSEIPKPSDDIMERLTSHGLECIICNRTFNSTYHLLSHYHYSYPRLAFVANCEPSDISDSVQLKIDVYLDPSYLDIDEVGHRKRWESEARWMVFPSIVKHVRANMKFDASIFSKFIPAQMDYFNDDLSNSDQFPEIPTVYRAPENSFIRNENFPAAGWELLSRTSGRRLWGYMDLSYELKVFYFTWNTMIFKIGIHKIAEIGVYRLTKLYIHLHRRIIEEIGDSFKEVLFDHIAGYFHSNSDSNLRMSSLNMITDLQARVEDPTFNGFGASDHCSSTVMLPILEFCYELLPKYEEWKQKTEHWPKTPLLRRKETLWPNILKTGCFTRFNINGPEYEKTYQELIKKKLLPPDHESRIIAEDPLDFFKKFYAVTHIPSEMFNCPDFPPRNANNYSGCRISDRLRGNRV